jgi:hypothetical protein
MPTIRSTLVCAFDVPEGTIISESDELILPDGTVLELVMGLWDSVNDIAEATQLSGYQPRQIGYEKRWGIMGMEYVGTHMTEITDDA